MKTLKFLVALGILLTGACHKETILNITPVDFLSDAHYRKLVVEVQYPQGYQPTAETVDRLRAFLEARLNKPDGISIELSSIPLPRKDYYTVSDIKNIEDKYSKERTHRHTLAAYIFFADGAYAGNDGNSQVLGMAYRSTSIAIFEKTVRDFSGGLTQPATSLLEETVTQHEFGHLMGLVNNGTGMLTDHQDEPNGKHCDDQHCLMYFNVETSDVIANLTGSVPELDVRCLEDLRANGGK
jgi:predicted Zn-dependent protease